MDYTEGFLRLLSVWGQKKMSEDTELLEGLLMFDVKKMHER